MKWLKTAPLTCNSEEICILLLIPNLCCRTHVCKLHNEAVVRDESLKTKINVCPHNNYRMHALLSSRSVLNDLFLHIEKSYQSLNESVASECHRVYYLLKVSRNYKMLCNETPIQVIYIGKHKQDISRPMLHLKQVVGKLKIQKLGVQVNKIKDWLLLSSTNEVGIISVPLCSEILAFSVEDYLLDLYQTNPNSGRKTVTVDENVKVTAARYCDTVVRLRHRGNDYDHITTFDALKDKSLLFSELQ